jgi:hypothetical protein
MEHVAGIRVMLREATTVDEGLAEVVRKIVQKIGKHL